MTLGAVMSAEMAEQPARLAALLGQADAIAGRLREVLPEPLTGTVLIARGSSDHAGDDRPLSPGTGDPPGGGLGIPEPVHDVWR